MRIARRLAPIALALTVPLLLVACGDDGEDGAGSATDARALLRKAFSNPPGSGRMKVRLGVDLEGVSGLDGPIAITVRGPFASGGDGEVPRADLDFSASAGGLAAEGGLKLTGKDAYVEFQGDSYELGELLPTAGGVEGKQGGSPPPVALDPSRWLEDPKIGPGGEIGGDSTRRVSGDVDAAKAARDLLSALRSPALRRRLGPGAELIVPPKLGERELDGLRDAVKDLGFEADVDDGDVLRRLLVKARFEVPRGAAGTLRGGTLTVDYVLEKVGGELDVKAPRDPQPLGQLLRKFGLPDLFGPTLRQ